MNDRESLREVLTGAGFSKYEADVYLSVLELTDANVADIASGSQVPRSRVYDVLRDLEREGYLETYEQDSLRARIGDPAAVVEELTARSKELSEAAADIEQRWEQPPAAQSNIQVFRDHGTTLDVARSRLSEAETIVHLAVSPDELEALEETLESLHDRGVIVQLVLHGGYETDVDPAELEPVYRDVATEVRFCRSLLPFIALINGDLTILGVQSQRGKEYGMAVNDHILSSILHWYFQIQLWEPWDTVYSSSDLDEMTYVSIRELIRDIESIRDEDETVTVRVEGIDTLSGDRVTITGTVDDIVYTDAQTAGDQTFSSPFIQAAIAVTEGNEKYTIGGYGAILEDVRATRITLLSIG
jgi:sugar-specific transcriptional regulator TrmB